MREELDYEATKAALRAQVSASPASHHALPSGWRWFSAVAGVIVVVCAVTITLWATHGGSSAQMRLVPSAGHETARAASTAPSAPAGKPALAPPAASPVDATAPFDQAATPTDADGAFISGDTGSVAGGAPVAPGPVVPPRTETAATGIASPRDGGSGPSRPTAQQPAPNPPATSITPPVVTPPVTSPPTSDPPPASGGGASDPAGSGGGGGQSSGGGESGDTAG
ncbi:hypothetical protein ACQ7HM_04510 [Williamsia sp. MIQD14]|uniref:hypothetical protein n=1 Tax=Williamsia sp. MIQD14 TaxID=3425703 RepID=UPI003DA10736